MRTIIALTVTAFLLSGCLVGVSGHRHYRHHRHGLHVRHSYHSHHHWNSSGPAYDEAGRIRELTVLPVALPEKIEGEFTAEEEAEWRKDWPMEAADLIAERVTDDTEKVVTATTGEAKPSSGYYIEVKIQSLDLGEKKEAPDPENTEGWSDVFATGTLVNASTGELVAEIKFKESSSRFDEVTFERDMDRVGESLSSWLKLRRQESASS